MCARINKIQKEIKSCKFNFKFFISKLSDSSTTTFPLIEFCSK